MAEGRIEGVVLDARGRPLADCPVLLTGASPDHRDLAALTADDGTFSFLELEPGRYEVLAQSEGEREQSEQAPGDGTEAPALSRAVERFRPTLIIEEADAAAAVEIWPFDHRQPSAG